MRGKIFGRMRAVHATADSALRAFAEETHIIRLPSTLTFILLTVHQFIFSLTFGEVGV